MAAAVAQDRWFDVRVRGPVAGPDSFGAARALTPVRALNGLETGTRTDAPGYQPASEQGHVDDERGRHAAGGGTVGA
jgi:hypothetical protein